MASENHASYAKIGLTVILGAVATAVALIYFGGFGDRQNELLAETYYRKPVSGLSIGSEVNFRGVKVGEVRDISFLGCQYNDVAEDEEQDIYILIAFNTRLFRLEEWESPEETIRFLVDKGMRATVTSSGVTGLSRIELNFPRVELAPERISWTPEHICIPPAPSMFDNFSDSVTRIMTQINRMNFVSTWSNVTAVADSFARLADNLNGIVEGQRSRVDGILQRVESAADGLGALVDELKANPSLLIRSENPEPLPETADGLD